MAPVWAGRGGLSVGVEASSPTRAPSLLLLCRGRHRALTCEDGVEVAGRDQIGGRYPARGDATPASGGYLSGAPRSVCVCGEVAGSDKGEWVCMEGGWVLVAGCVGRLMGLDH